MVSVKYKYIDFVIDYAVVKIFVKSAFYIFCEMGL